MDGETVESRDLLQLREEAGPQGGGRTGGESGISQGSNRPGNGPGRAGGGGLQKPLAGGGGEDGARAAGQLDVFSGDKEAGPSLWGKPWDVTSRRSSGNRIRGHLPGEKSQDGVLKEESPPHVEQVLG